MSAPSTNPTGYITLVRNNANFRNLWFGQIISLLGDWFNLIASAALIAQLTESGLAIGGLFIVRFLAPFVITPFAGSWADRYNRKMLLIITDLTRGATVFGFLLVRTPEQLWLLYALTAIQLGISGVFFPTRSAILPDVVTRSELGAANALSSATWSVMLAFGAALGGLSAGIWGIYPSFIIDGITFFISAYFIFQIKYNPKPQENPARASILGTLKQYAEGIRYLKAHPDLMVLSLIKPAGAITVTGAFQVLQVYIAEKIFVIGEGGGVSLGLIYTVVGIGTGIGPIIARKFTGDNDRAMRLAIISGFGIASIGLFLTSTLASFPVVLFGTLLRGFGVGLNWVFSTQLLLMLVPDKVRGRIFSTEFAMLTLMNAAGSGVGGWIMDSSFNIGWAFGAMGILVLVPGFLWAAWTLIFKRSALSADTAPVKNQS